MTQPAVMIQVDNVSKNFGGTDLIFLGMITLGILGFLTDRAFVYAIRRYAHRYHLQ